MLQNNVQSAYLVGCLVRSEAAERLTKWTLFFIKSGVKWKESTKGSNERNDIRTMKPKRENYLRKESKETELKRTQPNNDNSKVETLLSKIEDSYCKQCVLYGGICHDNLDPCANIIEFLQEVRKYIDEYQYKKD